MQGIVDRFEGDYVVIEIDGVTRDIPKASVHPSVQPGDVVEYKENLWITNSSATAQRTKEIEALMNDVWED